jgi:signal transduction histidine kinase
MGSKARRRGPVSSGGLAFEGGVPPNVRMRGGLRLVVLVCLVASARVSVAAEPPVRHVLVLQSFDRGNLILDHFTTNLRVELDHYAGGPTNFIQINVGPTGFVGASEQSIVDFVRSTFDNRPKPDLILTIAGPAAVFARKHRQQLFPESPLLLAAVDQRYVGDAPLGENEAAVTVLNDFPGLVDGILQVRPKTRMVFVVVGSGAIADFWRLRLEEQFSRFDQRLKFVWSNGLSFSEILRRSSTLPPDSAIFYLVFGTDAAGASYADERAIADLHATANAPLFSLHSVFLGRGIVGGKLMDIDELVRRTSKAAYDILSGVSPNDVRVAPQPPGRAMFDWRELQRWGISESLLPADSSVIHRGPTLWSEHRGLVLVTVAALSIQALLIAGLLFERRARRRAEFESRRNLALASDVSRRETMSALTSSIAHELVQPISAMLHNAEALLLMTNSKRATPEDIHETLSDIQAGGVRATEIIDRHRAMLRSRQMEKKPIKLQTIVNDTLTLVAHDIAARQVEVVNAMSPNACVIEGDPVLLEQVFVNLVMNAMDAVGDTPQSERRITITSMVSRTEAQVSVCDTGPGLPAELAGKLFTPFATTKQHGLGIGLAITRTIVEAHGGSIEARNHSTRGAIFTVTLPVKLASADA